MNATTPSLDLIGDTAVAGSRYIALDGLRGVAALVIVIHHLTSVIGTREYFASASIAVDFFFCLSGFVIALAYHHRLAKGMGLRAFVRRRFVRLYPMYLCGTAIGIVATAIYIACGLTDMTFANLATATALNMFYLPYLNDRTVTIFTEQLTGVLFPMNNPAWSLLFGILANLTFATVLPWSRRLPLVMLGVSALLLVASTLALGEAPGWGYANMLGGFPRVMFSFFTGVVIFQYRDRMVLPRIRAVVVFLAILLLVGVPRFQGHRFYWLGMALVVMPVLVAVGSYCVLDRATPLGRMAVYFGKISYTVFCVHYPLLMLFFLYPVDHALVPVVAMLFLATTVLVAHFLTFRVEAPMRDWLARRIGTQ